MPVYVVALILILVGVLLWLVETYIPMDSKIKKVLNIFVFVVVILWIMTMCHAWSYLESIKIG
jgi:membrane-bound ClpP family serine protease